MLQANLRLHQIQHIVPEPHIYSIEQSGERLRDSAAPRRTDASVEAGGWWADDNVVATRLHPMPTGR